MGNECVHYSHNNGTGLVFVRLCLCERLEVRSFTPSRGWSLLGQHIPKGQYTKGIRVIYNCIVTFRDHYFLKTIHAWFSPSLDFTGACIELGGGHVTNVEVYLFFLVQNES